MAELIGNPNGTFQDRVQKLEPTDLAVPETWNPIHQALITNDVILHGRVVALEDQVGGTSGGSLNQRVGNLEAVVRNQGGGSNPEWVVLPVGTDRWAP
ncbi:hypothetical protein CSW39_09260 [Thermus scotoductus]|uniref:Uncharacterized protein n=2 Tax=Thermus scotoductus TaxID=37636 RepID=A0A430R3S5_THESC|nr:hypothetical protein [Thermus scotoductus]RTG94097.1 hypothetical protein CSW49_09210 [Thermus scotoductus]RTH02034.1 hypothetical protein CSW45_08770 [Thermus scotoductus]RTH07591.1 hypothetical protein CSW46_09655 [Thermus scotoductus]RTH09147.1 hypothetical protein CSW44_09910 [Thermus scotoductus]RTH16426.1 hypothetical protein CSW39_09260 [Thermus scotoductus]